MPNTSSTFLRSIVDHLAANKPLIELVAQQVAKQLTGRGALGAASTPAPKRAPRPAKKKAPAKSKRAAPAGKSAAKGGTTDRVLEAVRGGASTKQDIIAKSKVTDAGYSYALKTLKEKGIVRIQGTKRQAKIFMA